MTDVHPVTPDRWPDLRALFGDRGAYSHCWCTWWRLPAAAWSAATPSEREAHLAGVVREGRPAGLLAYRDGVPVGWAALSPRADLPRVERSPHLRPVDDVPVWAVPCFWVPRDLRRSGVATALLEAAVEHAARAGAPALEGYPVDPAARRVATADAFTGTLPLFLRAGFVEVARRSPTARVVVRRALGQSSPASDRAPV